MTYLFCLVFEEYANVYLDFHRPQGSGDAMRKLAQDSGDDPQQVSHHLAVVKYGFTSHGIIKQSNQFYAAHSITILFS